jgi:transcriptional regulator with XRE-family HTH domain
MPPSKDLDAHSPMAVWGAELRYYRELRTWTLEQLAAATNFAVATLSSVETARRNPSEQLAKACDRELDTGGALVRLLKKLKELELKAGFPAWFPPWLDVETRATRLRSYELSVVYGLLQTESYARALLGGDEQAVAARLGRQAILTREEPPPPKLHCVLAETVLHNQIGDATTMHKQLDHLVASADPRLSIQIVPYGAEHIGFQGSFVIADVDGNQVAYVESAVRGMTLGSPEDLAAATDVWESVRTAALSQQESLELIRKAAERWT